MALSVLPRSFPGWRAFAVAKSSSEPPHLAGGRGDRESWLVTKPVLPHPRQALLPRTASSPNSLSRADSASHLLFLRCVFVASNSDGKVDDDDDDETKRQSNLPPPPTPRPSPNSSVRSVENPASFQLIMADAAPRGGARGGF
ncbi:hypothetical protein EMPG_16410, partial [Blastomyces silverae]